MEIQVKPQEVLQGTHTTASYQVQQAFSRIGFVADFDLNERKDPTKSCWFAIERSEDNLTWVPVVSAHWQGEDIIAPSGERSPNPSISVDFNPDWVGQRFRVTADIPVSMKFGAYISVE